MVKRHRPKIGETDPRPRCCGTGGFLAQPPCTYESTIEDGHGLREDISKAAATSWRSLKHDVLRPEKDNLIYPDRPGESRLCIGIDEPHIGTATR